MIKNTYLIFLLFSFFSAFSQSKLPVKPTICILGGTPSSTKIIEEIPIELKAKYNFISFNRPGFGNTLNEVWNENRLFELAKEAGLKKNDFAVIGVSGGGPLAILLARKFKLKHCGVISGMVPGKEYFAYADSTFTKSIMTNVVDGFSEVTKTFDGFPNVAEILKQADSPVPVAIRACYDELHFILTDLDFDKKTFRKTKINWLHGENDKNVALESVQLFLSKFNKVDLNIIPDTAHAVDARVLVSQLIDKWEI